MSRREGIASPAAPPHSSSRQWGEEPMPTYMIFLREGPIVDAEAMAAYQRGNRDGAPPAGLKPLVVYGDMKTLEGEPADGMVLLEFPDRASAEAWYYSPEYQERAKLRQKGAPYRAFMVDGL
jgi:uncharacterized protein (DUF1330 family)